METTINKNDNLTNLYLAAQEVEAFHFVAQPVGHSTRLHRLILVSGQGSTIFDPVTVQVPFLK